MVPLMIWAELKNVEDKEGILVRLLTILVGDAQGEYHTQGQYKLGGG